jgi:hypothetical protein
MPASAMAAVKDLRVRRCEFDKDMVAFSVGVLNGFDSGQQSGLGKYARWRMKCSAGEVAAKLKESNFA